MKQFDFSGRIFQAAFMAVLLLMAGNPQVNAQTISGSTACSGSVLTLTSTNKPLKIVWKNGASTVQTSNAGWSTTATTSAANGLYQPATVFVDGSGNLYVGDGGSSAGYVIKYPPGSNGSTAGTIIAQNGIAPGDMAAIYMDAGGNLYVALAVSSKILKFPPGSNSSTVGTVFAQTGLNYPYAVFVDAAGNVYAANYNGNNVVEYPSTSNATTTPTIVAASGLTNPTAAWVDASGNLYTTNSFVGQVLKFPPGSTSSTTGTVVAQSGLSTPNALAVDGSGNIYVPDGGVQEVLFYPAGSNSSTVPTVIGGNGTAGSAANQLSTPYQVYLDLSGNVYVADYGNVRVQKLTNNIGMTYTTTAAGSYTAQVSDFQGGSATSNTVTIGAAPGTITGTLAVISGGTTTLSCSPSGGTWTSGSTGVATIGSSSGIVNAATPGTSLITYATGCTPNATATVTVGAVPSVWYSSTSGGDASNLANWWSNNNNTGFQPTTFSSTGVTWTIQSAMTSTAALTFGGNVSIVSGSFTPLSGSTTTVGGNWKNTGGTFSHNGGTVLFNGANGAAADTLSGSMTGSNAFHNLTFNSSSVPYTFLGNAADVGGNFLQSSGTVKAPSATLKVSGNFTQSSGNFTPNGGTVMLNGSSGTISASSMTTATTSCFNNLSFNASSSATYTVSSDLLLMGDFTNVTSNGTIALGTNTITVGGNWANPGAFTTGNSHVIMNGSSPVTMTGKR